MAQQGAMGRLIGNITRQFSRLLCKSATPFGSLQKFVEGRHDITARFGPSFSMHHASSQITMVRAARCKAGMRHFAWANFDFTKRIHGSAIAASCTPFR